MTSSSINATSPKFVGIPQGPTRSPALEQPPQTPSAGRQAPEGERRQLTVMFCDLVGSTALSEQLDPEDLQTVVRTYQEVSAQVIERYKGYIAQYLGDGLLVYFGYPTAHEDDAARAIHAGLEIVTALHQAHKQFPQPVQVRIGIHTGPVVVGQMGGGSRHEQLALGETPNIAARVQGKAAPDSVVISSATYRLVEGLFTCQDLGPQDLKGISTALALYQVRGTSEEQSRFEVAVRAGLAPLVGRAEEVNLLRERWQQATRGEGQAVSVSGEAGIGKSRLVEELREHVDKTGGIRIAYRCSPYHQNSALYPVIAHVERVLGFASDDTPGSKLEKLQSTLSSYRFPQAGTVPLLATLLSLPHPEGYPPLTASAQKQKAQTQEALVTWLFEETEKAQVCCTWEDLHWADPSTLEFLTLCLDQIPTARMLVLLVFRPEFTPSWGTYSYLSQLTLSRLGRPQVEGIVERVTAGRALPGTVVEQVVAKTDGVPLFVEELTKMIVESGLLRAVNSHYELTGPLSALAIPTTLHDSLMARLDRLGTAKEVAQLGAVIGREFSYELLHAVSSTDEETLQTGLAQLVAAELVYQRGRAPEARYLFKHALVQDTAYQSLLKSKRREYHQQIAQVLEERFAETVVTQPELVAHHYTEARVIEQAIPNWLKAGRRANQRSAYTEATHHLTIGLELLQGIPDTPQRSQQELSLQITLGATVLATRGFAAPEVGNAYTRARELCQQIGETPQLFPVLAGLRAFYTVKGESRTARKLGEQLLRLAHNAQSPAFFLEAHYALGISDFLRGALSDARSHLEYSRALYDVEQHRSQAFLYSFDTGVAGLSIVSWVLWFLGYPDQALQRQREALVLAEELTHSQSLAFALIFASALHLFRRGDLRAREYAERAIALSTEQGLTFWRVEGVDLRGCALVAQGHGEEGLSQIREGIAGWRATGAQAYGTSFLLRLSHACGQVGRTEEGLTVLAEAFALVDKLEEHYAEAELYRLKGELTLQSQVESPKPVLSEVEGAQGEEEVEACFQKALEIAQHQQAKSWELRAATSLARLWQGQGKQAEARDLLTPVYNWFTEGFDTQDLRDAKVLLEELSA